MLRTECLGAQKSHDCGQSVHGKSQNFLKHNVSCKSFWVIRSSQQWSSQQRSLISPPPQDQHMRQSPQQQSPQQRSPQQRSSQQRLSQQQSSIDPPRWGDHLNSDHLNSDHLNSDRLNSNHWLNPPQWGDRLNSDRRSTPPTFRIFNI